MSTFNTIQKIQNKVKMAEERLIPLRMLSAKLHEKVRKAEEAFAYTNQRETPTHKVSVEGVTLELSASTLLKQVDDEIARVLLPLEKEQVLLKNIDELIKESTYEP
ncbi:MAG: hypothetical protein GY861_04795 [bacterium]|nr:hypothetical protein [bacterium]